MTHDHTVHHAHHAHHAVEMCRAGRYDTAADALRHSLRLVRIAIALGVAISIIVTVGAAYGDEAPVVNVTTATAEQLAYLPGIGPVIAQRIIDYRASTTIQSVDQLLEVNGIGPVRMSAIRPYVVLEGDTTASSEIHEIHTETKEKQP